MSVYIINLHTYGQSDYMDMTCIIDFEILLNVKNLNKWIYNIHMNYKEATEKLINQLYKDIRLDHLKIELLKRYY